MNQKTRELFVKIISALIAALLVSVLTYNIVSIAILLLKNDSPDPQWIMVHLTSIFAMLTFFAVAAATRSAKASENAINVMNASIDEQRQSRFAQFFPALTFTNGYRLEKYPEFHVLRLRNLYSHPIMGLMVMVWFMEDGPDGSKEVKYSSMLVSLPEDVSASQTEIVVTLKPATIRDSESTASADYVLNRFKQVYNDTLPKSALCAITFAHRASFEPAVLVYDLEIV